MKTFKCKNCNYAIPSNEVVGNWIKCPLCGSISLVDYSIEEPSSPVDSVNPVDNLQENAGKIVPDKLCEYYFPVQSTFEEFEAECFNRIMQVTPTDFTGLMNLEKREAYLPFVANIGGDDNSRYRLQYVGKEEINFPFMDEKLKDGFANNHQQFGIERRIKDCSLLKNKVEVSLEKINTLRKSGNSMTDEIHYYPCYHLCCQCKAVKYNFFAFGNSDDICYDKLPEEPKLKDSKPCYLSDKLGYRTSYVLTFLMVAAFLFFELYYNGGDINDFMNRHWLALINGDWMQLSNPIAVIGLIVGAVILLFIISLFSSIAEKILNFIVKTVIFFIMAVIVVLNIAVYAALVVPMIFFINDRRKKKYYSVVYPIQLQKQGDIKRRYGVEPSELYIDTSRVPIPFEFSELGGKWFKM